MWLTSTDPKSTVLARYSGSRRWLMLRLSATAWHSVPLRDIPCAQLSLHLHSQSLNNCSRGLKFELRPIVCS